MQDIDTLIGLPIHDTLVRSKRRTRLMGELWPLVCVVLAFAALAVAVMFG